MRIWIEFTKEAPMRYLSHLDLMRVWQRAIRRAALPLVYSQGFNPHPKMSFASALSVGVISTAEYLDIQFARTVQSEDFDILQQTLPKGITIKGWREVPDAVPALMSLIRAALWTVMLPAAEADVQQRLQQALEATELPVQRETKKGIKTIDMKPHIYKLEMSASDNQLQMLLASGGEGGVKPLEVLDKLNIKTERVQRDGLFVAVESALQSPMDVLLREKEVSVNAEADYYQL